MGLLLDLFSSSPLQPHSSRMNTLFVGGMLGIYLRISKLAAVMLG